MHWKGSGASTGLNGTSCTSRVWARRATYGCEAHACKPRRWSKEGCRTHPPGDLRISRQSGARRGETRRHLPSEGWLLPTSRQPWSDAYRGAWREALNSVYLKRGCGKPAHLPSSTLAASSWRHLPKARAWTVHLHSYHVRLLLIAAGVTYLKHAHGPCIYLLTIFDSGCSRPASSTSSTRMGRAFTFFPAVSAWRR